MPSACAPSVVITVNLPVAGEAEDAVAVNGAELGGVDAVVATFSVALPPAMAWLDIVGNLSEQVFSILDKSFAPA